MVWKMVSVLLFFFFFLASAEYSTDVPFAVLSFTQLPSLLTFVRMVDEYFLN